MVNCREVMSALPVAKLAAGMVMERWSGKVTVTCCEELSAASTAKLAEGTVSWPLLVLILNEGMVAFASVAGRALTPRE